MKNLPLILTLATLLACVVFFVTGHTGVGGASLSLLWIFMGWYAKNHPKVQGSFYTFLVLACVTFAMFFPQWFIEFSWNCDALGIHWEQVKWTRTIVPLLQIVMFGMGTQLTLGDFRAIAVQPKGVIVGMISQFSIMPILGCTLAALCALLPERFGFSPEILAGIILVGCSPSGMASNVIAFIARANIALSVTLTACATLMAPLLTPLLMKYLANQYVEIEFLKMMSDILSLILFPILAGLLFRVVLMNGWNLKKVFPHALTYTAIIYAVHALLAIGGLYPVSQGMRLGTTMFFVCILGALMGGLILRNFLNAHPMVFTGFIKAVSSLAICVILIFSIAAGRDDFLRVGPFLVVVCLIHNLFGYLLGYHFSRLVGLEERDCRTVSIEVGMQNGGLGTTIAIGMGKVATVGLAPAIFGTLMNITGSILASFWQKKNHEQ